MTAKQIDYLNIGLMLFACIVAIYLPFQLFLVSYAILGPLHYLTEIGWLDNRNYFSKNKKDARILVFLCALVSIAFAIYQFPLFESTKNWSTFLNSSRLEPLVTFFVEYEKSFIFIAFYIAVLLTFVKQKKTRYLLIIPGVIAAYFLNEVTAYVMIIGIMLPTVIHVYLFTGAFILFGALKSKSVSGYASLMVFIFILFLIILQRPKAADYQLSEYWINVMKASSFHKINFAIADFFGWVKGQYFVFSTIGLKMQIFIAFAYTYHYLNWFSKTKIINWHKVSKTKLVATAIIWICSVALYFYDYKLGLAALFFLSVLHVFLEFPLNHLTFVGIYNEVKNRILPNK